MYFINYQTKKSVNQSDDDSLGCLDLSRQFEKVDLEVMDNLDTLKKLVSTLRTFSTVQKPSLDSLDYSKN